MTSLTYRPDIDGLRAVAVLAVVLNHLSASLLPGGYVGVDVFFVISGYLITSIISREMAEGRFTFAGFYERRARRIFPALFAMLLVTLAVSYFVLLPSDMASTLRGALGTVFFTSNMVFWREMKEGYFAATDLGLNPLLHTWSLSVEEQFYVFFPVLLLLCFKYARRYIPLILVACAVASLAAAALFIKDKSVAVFFLAPFRAWELLAGSLLALNVIPTLRSRFWRELCAAAGLVAILVACFLYDHKTTFPGMAAVLPVLGAAAVIHAGAGGNTWVGGLLQLRPMVYVGLISYSLYLWHWPLIVFVRYITGFAPITTYIPVLFAASLLLAHLSHRFIEKPFRHGASFGRRFIIGSSVAVAMCVTLVATTGLVKAGFESRFSPEVVLLDKARTPQIPFKECDNKPAGAWCSLGNASSPPQTLLWGDSHLLAWAPALDVVMRDANTHAVFAGASACAPMFGAHNAIKPACEDHSRAVQNYLNLHPSIETVVLSAYWSTYFHQGGPLTSVGDPTAVGEVAAANALRSTIQWLQDSGKKVVLIGPVPVHTQSVPLALALQEAFGHQRLSTSYADQRKRHASFFDVATAVDSVNGPSFHFLDPLQWFCEPDCRVMKDGMPLYRDSHHLSAAGAIEVSASLVEVLKYVENGMTSSAPDVMNESKNFKY